MGLAMGTETKLRVIVFDDDKAMTDLFKKMLQGFGHHVTAFSDPTACPVYKTPECNCPCQFPCAEVIITDNMMPNMTGIDFLKLQRRRGCKALDANKALMTAAATPKLLREVKELGCHFFRKPFRLSEVRVWLEECAERVPNSVQLKKLG